MSKEVRKFEAETQKVLDLMIHSLYSNKDIFLRELIANASDAIDKLRFESLLNTSLNADWTIRIDLNKKKKTLSISDNGTGMSKEDVIANVGTIAQSGTKRFLEALKDKEIKDAPELIGQFGVGFYSAFMVADKITIETKKAGSEESAVKWTSKGDGEYTLEESSLDHSGTTIVLHLKKDAEQYLDSWKIKEIVKKYSDFIEYPIKMKSTVKEAKKQDETQEVEGDDKKKADVEYIDVEKDEIINSQQAIWLRSKNEIKEEEYNQFFKHLSHSSENPLKYIHYSAEGTTEFKAIIYIPAKSPYNLFYYENKKKNLHLYIKRVFITSECPNLLPEYLRFVDGVVDSKDLPLNVSRENLQDNPIIEKIEKNLVKKILSTLSDLKESDPEKYESFFKELGRCIKEGVHTDYANREKLQDLLLFESMNNPTGKLISLKSYVESMPKEQKEIYYIIGENRGLLENSPHLEIFRSKGFDVLFMTDPIDEFVTMGMFKYNDKDVKAVGKGDIDLDGDDKESKKVKEEIKKEYSSLLEFIQKKLDKDVKEVRFSNRLTDSACCLVGDAYDSSPYMEKIMKSMNQAMPKTKRILELNQSHPIVNSMKKLYDLDSENQKLAEFAELLYDQALLTEGSPIANPLAFSKRLSELIVLGLNNIVSSTNVEK